jgi:hypothetical protein
MKMNIVLNKNDPAVGKFPEVLVVVVLGIS